MKCGWRGMLLALLGGALAACASSGAGLVYGNGTLGFVIELPARWQGHVDIVEHPAIEARQRLPRARSLTEFRYRPQQRGQPPQPLLYIATYRQNDWSALGAAGTEPPGTMLALSDGVIYVGVVPAVEPYPQGSTDAAEYRRLQPSLREVRRSFQLALPVPLPPTPPAEVAPGQRNR